MSRGTGVVQLTDGGELLIGHSTWRSYRSALLTPTPTMPPVVEQRWGGGSTMSRMWKFMEVHTSGEGTVQRASFSSYPGMIASSDDFYLLDSGLVVLSSGITVFNTALYGLTKAKSTVLAWVRSWSH